MSRPKNPRQRKLAERSVAVERGILLGAAMLLWMLAISARLYFLQIIQYNRWMDLARKQQQHTVELAPQRGTIYDSQKRELAMSLPVDSICAVPQEIPDRGMVARLLAPMLGLNEADLEARLNAARSFCWIKRKVTGDEASRVGALNLQGIYFQKESKRFYPKGELAAALLGYVGMDGKGLAGIEFALDQQIAGQPGYALVRQDARRQSYSSFPWSGRPGKNVVLTIDENIQYTAERALAEAVEAHHAQGGVAVVQNPNTGEILAAAGLPAFDPNQYDKASPVAREDRLVSWLYEPGSTFKIVAVSSAVNEKLTRPDELIDCQMGGITLAGHTIHDHARFGVIPVSQVLAESSDVGAIKLGLRLGEQRLYDYILRFGFGGKTGIELPGEERGLLRPPSRWSGISIGEISMGQEISVTPLQLVSAYSAIANGGVLFRPRLVSDIFYGDTHDPLPPVPGRRVVSANTAAIMRAMFQGVVDHGTGTLAQLNGYTVGGKTGTAQKIDPNRAYSKTHVVASFVGFAPASRPQLTILVVIDTPEGQHYGREVAEPAFKEIAEESLAYLNVPQDKPLTPSLHPQRRTEELLEAQSGHWGEPSAAPAARPAAAAGVKAPAQPSDSRDASLRTISYSHSDGRPAPATHDTVVLNDGPMVKVPDFSGLAVREVARRCEQLGLELNLTGSGLAVQQDPPAGQSVPQGSRVVVQFAR